MLKLYLFKSALKIKKGINYEESGQDQKLLKSISLESLTPMIYLYTNRDYRSYTVSHMLEEYARGNIDFNYEVPDIEVSYENITIVNRKYKKLLLLNGVKSWALPPGKLASDWHKAHLMDDVVYEKASRWRTLYDGEFVGSEIVFSIGKKARRVSDGRPDKPREFLAATLVFMKFCFEKLGFDEVSRIVPKRKQDKYYDCVYRKEGHISVRTQDHAKQVDLGTHLKFIYTSEWVCSLSVKDIKEMYGL